MRILAIRSGSGGLSIPAFVFLIAFFVVPVGFIVFYSFGYKPGLLAPVSTAHLSLDRYAEVLDGPFLETFKSTVRISIVGTLICLLVAIPFADFRRMTAKILFAVSAEESRFQLNGALLKLKDGGIEMVATDGHRLALVEGGLESAGGVLGMYGGDGGLKGVRPELPRP